MLTMLTEAVSEDRVTEKRRWLWNLASAGGFQHLPHPPTSPPLKTLYINTYLIMNIKYVKLSRYFITF